MIHSLGAPLYQHQHNPAAAVIILVYYVYEYIEVSDRNQIPVTVYKKQTRTHPHYAAFSRSCCSLAARERLHSWAVAMQLLLCIDIAYNVM